MLKGGYSLCIMMVLNPVVILFYQNCSYLPVTQAKYRQSAVVERQVASESKATKEESISRPSCSSDSRGKEKPAVNRNSP